MATPEDIGRNVRRARVMAALTQEAAAERAGLSRVAYRSIESGQSRPRSETLHSLATALNVRAGDLMTPAVPLPKARFRSLKRMQGRDEILLTIALQLEAYADLERRLDDRATYKLANVLADVPRKSRTPQRAAEEARNTLDLRDEPIRDITGLLEEKVGVKVARIDVNSDAFFGLSIAADGIGPAIAVNTWDRISVERWIFSAAHELGHLVLHGDEFDSADSVEDADSEKEANTFASHFLMPEGQFLAEWEQATGLDLWHRVMKLKSIFRVSYRTVLFRISDHGHPDIWGRFQMVAKQKVGRTLGKWDEPGGLPASAFAGGGPETRRADEPRTLPAETFTLDRRARLVRRAIEEEVISTGRGAEILGIRLREMRALQADWV
jgi:Zn-dependent peptidase ImmA (M78 family)/DNA-binding XRE family transcriptional regulator